MDGADARGRGQTQVPVRWMVSASTKVWQRIGKAKGDSDWQAKEWMLLKAGLAVGREMRAAM
jgi:hypothetical protein